MLRSLITVVATLLFCLTEPGQQLLMWLDGHVDVDGMVEGAMTLVQSLTEKPAP